MSARVNARAGQVRQAARLFAAHAERTDPFAHRRLVDAARAGNPYVLAKLAKLGLIYDPTYGAIVRGKTN